MNFRILGPVEVIKDGHAVSLGPSKQRALLALLLLHLNEVVSRDRLIEDLWGDRAPETAATALYGYVSHLRKLLEPGNGLERQVLLTEAQGYVLKLDPSQLDLKQFELLARRGRRELTTGDARAAAETLAEALALWRSQPLAEFDSAPFALAERLRLEELLVATLEDWIEAELALGHDLELVGELETLVRQHPFRERLCGQLMLALYRSGRQTEALEVYRETRRKLDEQLGIEPGPELQKLQQAILRHEQAIAPAAASATIETAEGSSVASSVRTAAEGTATATPPEVTARTRRHPLRWPLLAVATAVAVATGLAFAVGGGHQRRMLLTPNSVGFIDAKTGRLSRSLGVGRDPRALSVAFDSLWVANYRDKTVTRIDRISGHQVTIPVGAHPTAIAASARVVWVWTLEGLLVQIDPRFDSASLPIRLRPQAPSGTVLGAITVGGGFVWVTVPPTTVIRVDVTNPRRRIALMPDAGVEGPIGYHDGQAWAGGSEQVFPIDARTRIAGPGIAVGTTRALSFGSGALWVLSGGPGHLGGVTQDLRRVDLGGRLIKETIQVGSDPVALTTADGFIWAASGSDQTVDRIDPAQNRVVDSVPLGASPSALAADRAGVWVAVH